MSVTRYRTPARRNSNPMLVESPMTQLANYAAARTMGPLAPFALPAVRLAARKFKNLLARKAAGRRAANPNIGPGKKWTGPVLSKKWLSASTGLYGGKFRKPKKTKNPKIETLCLKKGYHQTREVHGVVEDSHCTYIGHSTWNANMFADTIAGALIRKVFKKAGSALDNVRQEIVGSGSNLAAGWFLEYMVYNPATGVESQQSFYTTVDNDTFNSIVTLGFLGFRSHIENFLLNTDQNEPLYLNLYEKIGTGVTDIRLRAQINLVNEYVTLFSSTALKVQNRTAGDTVTPLTGDPANWTQEEKQTYNQNRNAADRIDNQPLKGYLYQFRGGEPRLKYPRTVAAGVNQLNYVTTDGLPIWNASALEADFIEPPVPKLWSNCNKSSAVRLQPGFMKKAYIAVKHSGKMVTLLKYLRAERLTADRVSGARGKMQLLGLEEQIRTVGSNKITIQYECEKKVGCITKSGSPPPLLSKYTAETKDVIGS